MTQIDYYPDMSGLHLNLKLTPDSTQLAQIARQMGIAADVHEVLLPPQMGKGFLRYYPLPYGIQVHHYRYELAFPFTLQSHNPEETGLYMLNINLSAQLKEKQVGEEQVLFSKRGGVGCLFYSPGHDSRGHSEANIFTETLFFGIPIASFRKLWGKSGRFCQYRELQEKTLELIKSALADYYPSVPPLVREGRLMQALGEIIAQFSTHEGSESANLDMRDVELQFRVRQILMDHLNARPPRVEELAQTVGMSPTKLKNQFKALFGQPIYQYYLSQKMGLACELLRQPRFTIAEIGHQLGYSNLSQFSAQFKKHHALTPARFRKEGGGV